MAVFLLQSDNWLVAPSLQDIGDLSGLRIQDVQPKNFAFRYFADQ